MLSGPGIHGNSDLHTRTFQIDRLLKGREPIQAVKLHVPLEISILLAPRDKHYILFLKPLDPNKSQLPSPILYEHIPQGEGLVKLDRNTLRAVQSGIAR